MRRLASMRGLFRSHSTQALRLVIFYRTVMAMRAGAEIVGGIPQALFERGGDSLSRCSYVRPTEKFRVPKVTEVTASEAESAAQLSVRWNPLPFTTLRAYS